MHFRSIIPFFLFLSIIQHVFADENLVAQKSVPAILFSHKVSSGLLKYQTNYDPESIVPVESFKTIAQELIDHCNSDAYIFINVPGLRKLDLVEYGNDMKFLQRYINSSSTKLKFEQVKSLPETFITDLIEYIKDKCQFEGHIKLRGNNSDDFTTYIDSGRRVIEINYSPLPENETLRYDSILDLDSYIREILAQLPSPDQTFILTSLHPSPVPENDYDKMKMFPELFKNLEEVEKNNMLLDVAPMTIKYNPKYNGMEDVPAFSFDYEFFEENKSLLTCIIAALIGFGFLNIAGILGRNVSRTQTVQSTRQNNVTKEKGKVQKVDGKTHSKEVDCDRDLKGVNAEKTDVEN
ncbi:Protein big1 [Maudiozyma exigua]|uniref:Protein BIG1 n=1 Tax=Maudiozyma exigua TaxID=34358 RepID=A0A9P7B5W5_MAUEX|nr:Protein big1 [Kazachstania exigua]